MDIDSNCTGINSAIGGHPMVDQTVSSYYVPKMFFGSRKMEGLRPLAWIGRWAMRAAIVVALCFISGFVGSALTRMSGHSNNTISYADFISIMLTAISLLMTVLAIFLAVAAFVGWTTIEQKVHSRTEAVLAKGFAKGGRLAKMIEKTALQAMYEGVQSSDDDLNEIDKNGEVP